MSAEKNSPVRTDRFSGPYRSYVLGLLFFVYVFNFVDRQVLAVLQEEIKIEFGLSDGQLGSLHLAFGIVYTFLGIPIARLADRSNRKNVLAAAIVVWSVMTALCGAAAGFVALLLTRIGVGAGEAGATPPAQSIISDYFPPHRRATALAIFSAGLPVGMFLGYTLGGIFSELYGWRMTFFLLGAPGLVFALLLFLTMREPVRGASEHRRADEEIPSLGTVFRTLWQRRSFPFLAFGAGFHGFVSYGIAFWIRSYLGREFGMSPGEIGAWLGPIFGISGAAGIFLSGYIADKLAVRYDDKRWYMWVPALSGVVTIPFALVVYLSAGQYWALAFLIPTQFFSSLFLAPSYAAVQGIAPLRMRAMAVAVWLLIFNLIGLGGGPYIVGQLSEILTAWLGFESLRYAMALCLSANLISVWLYLIAARTIRQDMRS